MGETCLPDELRTLFLFEKLTDRQLKSLCDHGHLARFEPGPICIEGEAATCFYVLIEGELAMSKRCEVRLVSMSAPPERLDIASSPSMRT